MVKTDYKQTELGLIPSDWEIRKLGEIADVVSGGTPSSFISKFWNGDINWYTPTEIGEYKYTFESHRKITKEGFINSSTKMLPVGAILLTSRAGIGDASILKSEGCTNQGFQSLVVKSTYHNEYIYYLIFILKNVFIQNASGSTFLEISPNKIRQIQIVIPPTKDEQTAIATILSNTDDLISSLEDLIVKKKAIKQGTMQRLLTPKDGWEVKKLGEIVKYKNGKSYENSIDKNGEYYLITLNSIDIEGKLKKDHLRVKEYDNSLKQGDLIMVLSDVAHGNFLGLTDVIPSNKYVLNQRMGALYNLQGVIPKFLSFYINYYQPYFKLSGKGSSQQNLGKDDILNFNIFLPQIAEQTAIAKTLSDMDEEIEALELKCNKYKQLKTGLMQQLLTGKIRLSF